MSDDSDDGAPGIKLRRGLMSRAPPKPRPPAKPVKQTASDATPEPPSSSASRGEPITAAVASVEDSPPSKDVITIKRKDGTTTLLPSNNREAVTSRFPSASATFTGLSFDASKHCRKCGIYHCHVCDKCLSGVEPQRLHNQSERHQKKFRERLLMQENRAQMMQRAKSSNASEAKEPCHVVAKHDEAEVLSNRELATELVDKKAKTLMATTAHESVIVPSHRFPSGNSRSITQFNDAPANVYQRFNDSTNHNKNGSIEGKYISSGSKKNHDFSNREANDALLPGKEIEKVEYKPIHNESLLQISTVAPCSSSNLVTLNSEDVQEPFEDDIGETVREIRTVDMKKPVEDLSVFEDGNVMYDISMEPDPVPFRVKRPCAGSDDDWGEQVVLPAVPSEEEKVRIANEQAKNQSDWLKFFQENRYKNPPPPSRRTTLLVRSRLEPVDITTSDSSSLVSKLTAQPTSADAIAHHDVVDREVSPVIHSDCTKPGCLFHCDACDAHMSGREPLVQHEVSAKHLKSLDSLKKASAGGLCSYPGCVYHCSICDVHLSGVEPRDQHLLSAKHLQKLGARQKRIEGSTSSAQRSPGFTSNTSSTGSAECRSFDNSRRSMTPDVQGSPMSLEFVSPNCNSPMSTSSSNHRLLGTDRLLNSAKNLLLGSLNASSIENASDATIRNCRKCGIYHCHVCDKCMSGIEPQIAHQKSERHQKKVRMQLMMTAANSESLQQTGEYSKWPWMKFVVSCTFPGCTHHCHLCERHITGLEPAEQHFQSREHQSRETRLDAPMSCDSASVSTISSDSNWSLLNDFTGITLSSSSVRSESFRVADCISQLGSDNADCSYPGCSYHCAECDVHLSGVEPRDQHLSSAKHLQKVAARSKRLDSSSNSPLGSPGCVSRISNTAISNTSSLTVESKGCFISYCFHHCYPCNMHFTGAESRDQHLQSLNHLKRAATYGELSASHAVSPSKKLSSNLDVTDYDTFNDCPQNSTNCTFHCMVCDKHFSGSAPKMQHESSDKHRKAVDNHLKARKRGPDAVDGLMPNAQPPVKKNEFALPDRRHAPLVKSAPSYDLDYQPGTASEAREYQREMFDKARDNDAICFLPTGTGKTLVSAMLIDFMLRANPDRPVLFIVDKVLLVLQQTKYLREQIGERNYLRYGAMRRVNVVGMCGGKIDLCGARIEATDVLVATAGLVQNLLDQKAIRWLDFSLVVLDEIHHCEKNHPYRRLIDKQHTIYDYTMRPKLFGMTASPAAESNYEASLSRLRNLLRAIGGARLCKVENCLLELLDHQSDTKLEFEYVALSQAEQELQRLLQTHLLACYRYLLKTSDIKILDFGIKLSDARPEIYNVLEFDEETVTLLHNNVDLINAVQGNEFYVNNVLKHVYVICSALMGITICGEIAAYNVLQDIVDDVAWNFKSMAGLGLQSEGLFKRCRDNCQRMSVQGYVMAAIKDGNNMSAYAKLMTIILDRVDWNSRDRGEKPLVLILVRERKTAALIAKVLQGTVCLQEKGIRTSLLIGHGTSGEGMTVAKQASVLQSIRHYLSQIVVATSVAEEGLDLPSCDIVVELDPPGSVTSLVQIRGRARQKKSRLISICRGDSQELHIQRLVKNEQYMYKAIDQICSEQAYDDLDSMD